MKVLLVDDQRPVIDSFGPELERYGYEVFTATDVETAKAWVEKAEINVALVDLGLPLDAKSQDPSKREENPTNGLLLARWLRREKGIPLFVLTGATQAEILRNVEFPTITKPVKDFEEEVIEELRFLESQE